MTERRQSWEASVWFREREQGPDSARRRPRKGSPPLSRERLVEAAVRLLDRDGLAAFSMRALAAELDVSPMSAYWYVDTKDELLELALDEVFGEMLPPAGEDGPDLSWRLRAAAFAAGMRATLLRHPWAAGLFGKYLNVGPKAEAFSTACRSVLAESGLPGEQANFAVSALCQSVLGFAVVECQWIVRFADPAEEERFFTRLMGRIRSAGAWSEEMLDAPGQEIGIHEMRERNFAFSVETLLDGIESRAAAARG